MEQPVFTIARAPADRPADAAWDGAFWSSATEQGIGHFRPESSDHRPRTRIKAQYDDEAVHIFFRVDDRYVRSVVTEHNGPVCTDSCVEWFVQPKPEAGYFNFETNAGGTLHCSYIEDPTRGPDGFKAWTPIAHAEAAGIATVSSLPATVDPEQTDPVVWTLRLSVPLALFERYVGSVRPVANARWRGNFYKCGDKTSHPHWASWAPVDALNFHLPRCFAPLHFAE